MIALALVALVAIASPPEVFLAHVQCPPVADEQVRALLKVELRDRLADAGTPTPADFVLVSVSCVGDSVNILSVHQQEGSPTRRQVSFEGIGADARPRNLAVAIAEMLRGAPERPALMTQPAVDRDAPEHQSPSPPASLQLVEPVILMPLGTERRAGVRIRAGNTDVVAGDDKANFYVFGLEPFVEIPLGRGTMAAFTLPVTWTEGPGVSTRAQIANLTGALRYATGDRLRVGVGAAVIIDVGGNPLAAQAQSNLFELDRFRDATYSLRLQASALWRAERMYLQGEIATLLLGDEHALGTVLRSGIAAGIQLTRATVGAEYVVLSDVFDRYSFFRDRFVQTLIIGTRIPATTTTTLGAHIQLGLDVGVNANVAGALTFARSF